MLPRRLEVLNRLHISACIELNLDDASSAEVEECAEKACFDIVVKAVRRPTQGWRITASVAPIAGSKYEVIVDYFLKIGNIDVRFVEKDHWKRPECIEDIEVDPGTLKVSFGVNVHQALMAEDVRSKSTFRHFRVICAGVEFYVNPTRMKQFDCDLFDTWYDQEVTHEEFSVIHDLSLEEFETLLVATCAYSSTVVHSRNFHILGEVGVRLRVVGVVRAVDFFVGGLKTMHLVRKLELACNYRLTQTAKGILSMPVMRQPLSRLETLFDYLDEQGNQQEDLPPDVLQMLDIHNNYVIL